MDRRGDGGVAISPLRRNRLCCVAITGAVHLAFVVTVAQRKGGAGKSTVAANLAVAMAAAGHRVALLDTDPQQSLGHWHAERLQRGEQALPMSFAVLSGWRVPATLDRLRREQDFVILDTPPHDDTDARIAIRSADLVLMPLQPSAPDLWASDATVQLAKAERRSVVAVLNRLPPQRKVRDGIEAALATRGIQVLGAGLGNRAPFATAFAQGLAVTEAWPRSIAATEIRALAVALHGMVGV